MSSSVGRTRFVIAQDVESSIAAVETMSSRLGIMQHGSNTRTQWEATKSLILSYLGNDVMAMELLAVNADYTKTASAIEGEIKRKFCPSVCKFVAHVQNIQAMQ